MDILHTNQLSFKFKNHLILDRINIKVPNNSIYGYFGKNGAGKSTTIRLLLGLLKAPEDSIFFMNGEKLCKNRVEILKKNRESYRISVLL